MDRLTEKDKIRRQVTLGIQSAYLNLDNDEFKEFSDGIIAIIKNLQMISKKTES